MVALRDLGCGNCGGELPPAAKSRHIPSRGGRRLPVCDRCAKTIDGQTRLDGLDELDDDGLMRVVRGIAAVDRAVAKRDAPSLFAGPQPFPPAVVAQEMGWRLCTRCGRPVKPSWAIATGGDVFHPVCIMFQLGERAGAALGGARGLSAPPRGSLPDQGDAGQRIAADREPLGASLAA